MEKPAATKSENKPTGHDSETASSDLLDSVLNSPVTVGRYELKYLEQYGAPDNDQTSEQSVSRVSEAKCEPECHEGSNVLEAR
jgi:hypothetical protein